MRVGVDVGGTFTKAVALDAEGSVVARAVRPTTHDHADGVAAGVVAVVADIAASVGADRIELVTHSTTQAVNALLEGDVAPVGIVGMAAAPYVRKARKRTALQHIALTDGRSMETVGEFIDVTGGLDLDIARAAVERAIANGARAIAVSEAFAPDDTSNEEAVAELVSQLGLPSTTSAELTGLYGLELRTVTAAVNASILPIAMRTAEIVEAGVAAAGITAPVMVMRGDGGATDLAGFRKAPARTLYSGPAASVAGALRTERIADAVIVEVGGTSSNVAAISAGRRCPTSRSARTPRRFAPSTCASQVSPAGRCCASAVAPSTASVHAARTSPGCRTRASSTPRGSTGHGRSRWRRGRVIRRTTSCSSWPTGRGRR
jgi:N-methylhydantoinase A